MTRLVFSLVVIACLCSCGSAARERFPGIEAAGREITAVLTSNGTLDRFRAAVTAFSSEVSRAEPAAKSSAARAVLDQYREIDKMLQDILAVWDEKNARQQELLPLSLPLASRLAKQYDLPVNTNEPPSIYATEAMQMIWDGTKKRLAEIEGEDGGR